MVFLNQVANPDITNSWNTKFPESSVASEAVHSNPQSYASSPAFFVIPPTSQPRAFSGGKQKKYLRLGSVKKRRTSRKTCRKKSLHNRLINQRLVKKSRRHTNRRLRYIAPPKSYIQYITPTGLVLV